MDYKEYNSQIFSIVRDAGVGRTYSQANLDIKEVVKQRNGEEKSSSSVKKVRKVK